MLLMCNFLISVRSGHIVHLWVHHENRGFLDYLCVCVSVCVCVCVAPCAQAPAVSLERRSRWERACRLLIKWRVAQYLFFSFKKPVGSIQEKAAGALKSNRPAGPCESEVACLMFDVTSPFGCLGWGNKVSATWCVPVWNEKPVSRFRAQG